MAKVQNEAPFIYHKSKDFHFVCVDQLCASMRIRPWLLVLSVAARFPKEQR